MPEEKNEARDRHIPYNNALAAAGVTVIKGHHITDPESGKRNEKQSDINLALALICDAMDGVFDVAYLVTADSDHAATGRTLRERHPEKILFSVSPLDRRPPEKLRQHASHSFALTLEQIERALSPPSYWEKLAASEGLNPISPQIGGFIRTIVRSARVSRQIRTLPSNRLD